MHFVFCHVAAGEGGFHACNMSGCGGGSIGSPMRSPGGGGGSSVPSAGFCSSSTNGSTLGGDEGGYHVAPSIRTLFEEGTNFIHVFSFTLPLNNLSKSYSHLHII